MNEQLCLRTLASIMEWSTDKAREEYQWLRLISRFKYDGYREFVAGSRFLERLITWLSQFEMVEERQTAYQFARERLIYVSAEEMHKLVELFYFDHVRPFILRAAAKSLATPASLVWAHPEGPERFESMLRQTLFMGLSDGAHMDILRYRSQGELTNEQVVGFTQIDADKWTSLLEDLREDIKDPNALFKVLYVVDDFTASGTSLLRKPKDKWKGKLVRLLQSLKNATESLGYSPFHEEWILCIHHYLATDQAVGENTRRIKAAGVDYGNDWFEAVELSHSAVVDASAVVSNPSDADFLTIADRYYNPAIEPKKHLEESGIRDLRRGYGACSLSLVLSHNTPNNSLPIFWADSGAAAGHRMRPLFYRHQRHT
jgi:hypothetical protein